MEPFLGYLFIFLARVLDVSMATIRMLMVMRGKKYHAAIIGFFEVIIYIVALGKVVSSLNNLGNLLAYALGFATGNFVGTIIEDKVALGTITARIIPNTCKDEMVSSLRDMGFGVTEVEGMGKMGPRCLLYVVMPRKQLPKLLKYIEEIDSEAFITISDTRTARGGYLRKIKKK